MNRNGSREKVRARVTGQASRPEDLDEQYASLAAWSQNRSGRPQLVFSHESALVIWELSDAAPSVIYATVPKDFEPLEPKPPVLRLYREEEDVPQLEDGAVEKRDGHRVTTIERTLLDVANDPAANPSTSRTLSGMRSSKGRFRCRRHMRSPVGSVAST